MSFGNLKIIVDRHMTISVSNIIGANNKVSQNNGGNNNINI